MPLKVSFSRFFTAWPGQPDLKISVFYNSPIKGFWSYLLAAVNENVAIFVLNMFFFLCRKRKYLTISMFRHLLPNIPTQNNPILHDFLITGGFFKTFFLTCSFSSCYFFYPEMFSGAFDFPKALSPISWKVLTWCLRPNPSGSQDFLLHIKDDISHSSGGEHWREVVQKRKKK